MIYKTTWYSKLGDDIEPPIETWHDTLEEVATAISENAETWEETGRSFYVDWVDNS